MSLRHAVVSLLLASGMSVVAGAATAVTCSSSSATSALAGYVTSTLGCDVNTDPKTKVDSADNANAQNLFGFSNWQFLSRDNTDGGLGQPDERVVSISMTIAGNAKSGTVSIAESTWNTYGSLMLVLKADGFVHYLLSRSATVVPATASANGLGMMQWSYTTPFRNRNGAAQDISHFTIYGRVAPPTTPTTPTTPTNPTTPTPTGTGTGTTTGGTTGGTTTGGTTGGTTDTGTTTGGATGGTTGGSTGGTTDTGTTGGSTGGTTGGDQGLPSDGPWFGGSGGSAGGNGTGTGTSPTPAPIPVPAGGLLLVSALAGLSIQRRRRA